MRLDQYLAQKNPHYSRTFWQKAIKDGCIKMNGEVITFSKAIVSETDQVHISDTLPSKPIDENLKPENIPLDIVYEDDDVIVINKSHDMVVHPAFGNNSGTLVNALLYHTNSLSNDPIRPGIVHRLDKGTSGLMLVAKNDTAHFHLTKQFSAKTIRREYLALIKGVPLKTKDTINAPMLKDPKHFDRMKVDLYSDNAKEAITHYTVEEILGSKRTNLNTRFCLVRCKLETGRTHQIRVHMKHIGHPILGDSVYGYKVPELKRQFLHAQKITFIHPKRAEEMSFEIPMAKDLEEFLHALKI